MPSELHALGWDDAFARDFDALALEGCKPARVSAEHRSNYRVLSEAGEWVAELSGRVQHEAELGGLRPAVGDWVAVEPRGDGWATIRATLPRRSQFVRRAPGSDLRAQVVAANVDIIFLVNALGRDFNLRRIERYLSLAWESGAVPVIVLTKADLCTDADERAAEVGSVAIGVSVCVASAVDGRGLDELRTHLAGQRTGALLGSSGVGKSSLINRLVGTDLLAVGAVRQYDEKGRHTTSHRQLVGIPGGGLLIDTPGMRELQLWDAAVGIASAFDDIEALAAECRFADCEHLHEPDCAVRNAVDAGHLDAERLESWHKLQRELRHLERERDPVARAKYNQWLRTIGRAMRSFKKPGQESD